MQTYRSANLQTDHMVSQSEAARMLNVTHVTPRALCARQDGHGLMRFTSDRPYTDPDKAARKLVEIANSVEAVQDGTSISNWSTGRFYTSTRAVQRNTRPGLIWRSRAAGCCCTNPAPM
jgi:hypothetical protein